MRASFFLVMCLTIACSGDPSTALDVELIADLNLNSEADLAGALTHLRVELDSDEGLYEPGAATATRTYRVENVDSDAPLELLIDLPLTGLRLPAIRIEQGGLPDGPVDVRVIGLDAAGLHVASGGLRSVTFATGERKRVSIPFNLKPQYLPARVIEAYPRSDEETCRSGTALLVLSKNIDPSTVIGGVSVIVERDSYSGPLPASASAEGPVIRVAFAVIEPDVDRYHIRVTDEVTDTDGVPLDQDPGVPGHQHFVQDFSVVSGGACTDYPYRWCHESGTVLECPDFRGGRLRCEEGLCVLHDCGGDICQDGFVCHSASAACVVDCRVYGGTEDCPSGSLCNQNTGLCDPVP